MNYLPQWTRRVAMDGSGRDPLGLSRVSDALTGHLLPDIITTTDRARYYSFYTWAVSDIQALRQAKDVKSFLSGRVPAARSCLCPRFVPRPKTKAAHRRHCPRRGNPRRRRQQ